MHAFDELDRPGRPARDPERERGVVGLGEVRVLERRRVGQEEDRAAADVVLGEQHVVAGRDQRATGTGSGPGTGGRGVDAAHVAELRRDLVVDAGTPSALHVRRSIAEAVQVERIGPADHEPSTGARELQQRGFVGLGERLRIDHEDRAVGVEVGVDDRAAARGRRDTRSAVSSAASPPSPLACVP